MKKLFLSVAIAVGCCLSSASAAVYVFDAVLTGANEHNPNSSPGFGYSVVIYDDSANTLTVQALFAGLMGETTASHIHAPTAAPLTGEASVATTVPSFAGFPTGVTFGLYNNTLDLSSLDSYNPSFVTANGGTAQGAGCAASPGIGKRGRLSYIVRSATERPNDGKQQTTLHRPTEGSNPSRASH